MNEKLEKAYSEEDYKRPMLPYKSYLSSLEEVFDFSIIGSVLDLGCQNGRLIEAIKRKYASINVLGVDYFTWARDHADESIRQYVKLEDLAKPVDFGGQFDLVNSSEVGEHIEKESEDVFIDNLIKATRHTLVLTWSNQASHDHDQHQNPRPKSYIIKKIEAKGLVYWKEASVDLSNSLRSNLSGIGHNWWADDVMVFRTYKFFKPQSSYLVQQLNSDDLNHKKFHVSKGLYYISLQKAFKQLTEKILSLSSQKKAATVIRASDGDYFFIRKIEIGSAKPGKRALTKSYDEVNIPLYRAMFWHNDIIAVSIEKHFHNSWKKYLFYEIVDKILWKFNFKYKGKNTFKYFNFLLDKILSPLIARKFFLYPLTSFFSLYKGQSYKEKSRQIISKTQTPLESVYALVASGWIFKNFKNQIGIIAGEKKCELIEMLMKRQEYREYIGMDLFTDYIKVPQKGAADNVEELARNIGEQIKSSKAKIFLVGVGSAKIALMPMLKAYSDAIFIDAGAGIDALAGVVCQERPYFCEWVDYRINGYDYEKVDFMDQGNPAWNKKEYKTKWID